MIWLDPSTLKAGDVVKLTNGETVTVLSPLRDQTDNVAVMRENNSIGLVNAFFLEPASTEGDQ